MPFPIAEVVGAATTIAGGAMNMQASSKTNLRTRQHNEHMFNKQADHNLKLWNMQNEYNSPKQQMKRLKEAGLNPSMIYGQGNAGQTASEIQGPNIGSYSPVTPQVNEGAIGESMGKMAGGFLTLQKSILQENLKAEKLKNNLLLQQVVSGELDLGVKEATHGTGDNPDMPSTAESKYLSEYQNVATEAELKHLDLEEKKKFQQLSQDEQKKRIELLEKQIIAAGYENDIKQLKSNLAKQGINPDANITTEYWQQLRQLFKKL